MVPEIVPLRNILFYKISKIDKNWSTIWLKKVDMNMIWYDIDLINTVRLQISVCKCQTKAIVEHLLFIHLAKSLLEKRALKTKMSSFFISRF